MWRTIGLQRLATRSFHQPLPPPPFFNQFRCLSQKATPSSSSSHRRFPFWFSFAIGSSISAATVWSLWPSKNVNPQDQPFSGHLTNLPLSTVFQRYFVFKTFEFPMVVDYSTHLIEWAQTSWIPGVWSSFRLFIKTYFFSQFCGGETLSETLKVAASLEKVGLGAILAYSVEAPSPTSSMVSSTTVSENQSVLRNDVISELSSSIDVLTKTSQSQSHPGYFIAFKLSGIATDPSVLERVTLAMNDPLELPSLLEKRDQQTVDDICRTLIELCEQSRKGGQRISIAIDAEYSWMQPAIDAIYHHVAAQVNKSNQQHPPILFNTYQAYLVRTPDHLNQSLERANKKGYHVGVNLVRGAYMEAETQHCQAVSSKSPIWSSKLLTDQSYDGCAALIMDRIAQQLKSNHANQHEAALLASHNDVSMDKILQRMVNTGLASRDPTTGTLRLSPSTRGSIQLAQLFGMADKLTSFLSTQFSPDNHNGPPMVLKCLHYGPVNDLITYLARRAQENKSVLSNARSERIAAHDEILRRFRNALPFSSA